VTGLAAATEDGDAVRYEQAVKSGDASGGDLSGTFPNPTVTRLQGHSVSDVTPAAGQVLTWDASESFWRPASPSGGGGEPTGLAGGDLVGSFPDPSVAALRGNLVADSVPGSGQVLVWDSTAALWRPARNLRLEDNGGRLMVGGPVASGSGSTNPIAILHRNGLTALRVNDNGSALFGGTYDGGTSGGGIPAEGAGTRMMWYPAKAAFRSGHVSGTQWDDANIGYFSVAIGESVRASGDHGVAFGIRSTAAGSSTFAAGEDNTASGAASVALGYHAHTNARQGSFVFADRSTVDTLRAGVNHSASWRVSGGFRVFTSSNLSTGVTIQSGAATSNWGQSNAVISTSTGAYLSTAGEWQNVSDVNRKHLFEDVSGEAILGKIRDLRIQQWSYRVENDHVRHIGPTAQDFHAAFGLGSDDRVIPAVDAEGVALLGLQALEARTTLLQAENAALRSEVDALRAAGEAAEERHRRTDARLAQLEALLGRVTGEGGRADLAAAPPPNGVP